jgi:hypothetical protein
LSSAFERTVRVTTPAQQELIERCDGLLQDLVAAGLLLQLAEGRGDAQPPASDDPQERARRIIEEAPERLREIIDRLGRL